MQQLFRIKMFLQYAIKAKTKYYLHSPFVYQFYLHVIDNRNDFKLQPLVELRRQLSKDATPVIIDDLGAGNNTQKTIKQMEAGVAIPHQFGTLLCSLVKYTQPATIIELGTSIGISSAYMAYGNERANVFTMEGAPAVANVARQTHNLLGLKNIEVITGSFEVELPQLLNRQHGPALVFFDGNHTLAATLNYFELCLAQATEDSVFVFDDIYWSEDMFAAWQQIKAHPRVKLTIDVYRFGICFFKKDKLAKEDFVLWY
ncbi:MAG: class I SAM-dependent methyltransferase [Chitinophagales bacterium]|nr:class I SAM-dependent methyltransferase [Chitinophagales bacterium]